MRCQIKVGKVTRVFHLVDNFIKLCAASTVAGWSCHRLGNRCRGETAVPNR
jgi:hypothetical protein